MKKDLKTKTYTSARKASLGLKWKIDGCFLEHRGCRWEATGSGLRGSKRRSGPTHDHQQCRHNFPFAASQLASWLLQSPLCHYNGKRDGHLVS